MPVHVERLCLSDLVGVTSIVTTGADSELTKAQIDAVSLTK